MTIHSNRLNQSLSLINCASEQPFKPKVYRQVYIGNEAIVLRSSGIFPLSGLTWDFRLMQSDLTGSDTMCSVKCSLMQI